MTESGFRLEPTDGGGWQLTGRDAAGFGLVNDYLGYLADRNYSPRTVRAYGFDLLALCRWLVEQGVGLDAVTTVVLLDFLRACREATVPGRPSGKRGDDVGTAAGPVRGGDRQRYLTANPASTGSVMPVM